MKKMPDVYFGSTEILQTRSLRSRPKGTRSHSESIRSLRSQHCAPSARAVKNFRALRLRSRPGGTFFEGRRVRFGILSAPPRNPTAVSEHPAINPKNLQLRENRPSRRTLSATTTGLRSDLPRLNSTLPSIVCGPPTAGRRLPAADCCPKPPSVALGTQ